MTDIERFRIDVPDDVLTDLRRRLTDTRWPEAECVDDWSQGIPLAYTRELADYWATEYDWRACESALNQFDQYVTEIDGLPIHFVHQRSPHPDAFPLIITHGWPGSIVEFGKIIAPLTNPTAHGGRAEDAFHVVCPSLPGYGFSGKPATTGWNAGRIAAAWETLMTRLGYDRYGAQGGDWGAAVTTEIGRNVGHCAAIHTNMPIATPTEEALRHPTEAERDALAALKYYRRWDSGYAKQQSTRPQTIGYGLVDSPVALLAWIVEIPVVDRLRRPPRERPDPRRNPRQRNPVLDHRHRGLLRTPVLGEHGRVPPRHTSRNPHGHSLFPQGNRPLPALLVRTELQHHPLDHDAPRRALRRLRTTGPLHHRPPHLLRHRSLTAPGDIRHGTNSAVRAVTVTA